MGNTTSKKSSHPDKIMNYVSWFEIPALDLNRAVDFYNHIYGIKMEILELPNYESAFFPVKKGVGGAVVKCDGCTPSENGTLVYLNGGHNLDNVLNKVEEAGGRVIMTKTLINKESGYFAIFIDTEGNKLALHSTN